MQTNLEVFYRIKMLFPFMRFYKRLFRIPIKSHHAGLKSKFVNPDGSQMTIKERKLKYGADWIN